MQRIMQIQTTLLNHSIKPSLLATPFIHPTPMGYSNKQPSLYFGKDYSSVPTHALGRFLRQVNRQTTIIEDNLIFTPKPGQLTLPNASQENVYVVGIGSSEQGPKAIETFATNLSGKEWQAFSSEEFLTKLYTNPLFRQKVEKGFVIFISQSGESAAIVKAMRILNNVYKKAPDMIVVNTEQSTMRRLCPNQWYVGAGKETSIPATKSLTGTMAALLRIAELTGRQNQQWLSANKQRLSQLQLGSFGIRKQFITNKLAQLSPLSTLPNNPMRQSDWRNFAEAVDIKQPIALISYGPLMDALGEARLKMNEILGQTVSLFRSEDYVHGPKAAISGGEQVIYVIPPNLPYYQLPTADSDSKSNAAQVYENMTNHFAAQKPGHRPYTLFIIRFENSPPLPSKLQQMLIDQRVPKKVITLPTARNPYQTSFMTIQAFQLLSALIAKSNFRSIDHPALAKVNTV